MAYGQYSLHYEARGQVVVNERSGKREDTSGDLSVSYRFDVVEQSVENLAEALYQNRDDKAVLRHHETVVSIHQAGKERNDHLEPDVVEMLEQNGFEVIE